MADTTPSVELVSLDDIHPAPWNVRTGHDIDAIVESIRINGFRDPIEAWRTTGEIVAGEGRYHAARRLGLPTVPVIWHEFDSLASAKRYGIANNKTGDSSRFDEEALHEQLAELASLEGTGFPADYLAQLDPEFEPVAEDEEPRLDRKEPITCPHCGAEFLP